MEEDYLCFVVGWRSNQIQISSSIISVGLEIKAETILEHLVYESGQSFTKMIFHKDPKCEKISMYILPGGWLFNVCPSK